METPMSTRRVTRSQTMAAANNSNSNGKNEESEKGVTKSRQRNGKKQQQKDRSALIDITNDSPIVGLAMGGSLVETPASSIMKQRSNRTKLTPGSGEALLRGQVKTLLQRVEEEATAEQSKSSSEQKGSPFLHLKAPMGLLAPTPMNIPNVLNLISDLCTNNNDNVGSALVSSSPPVVTEGLLNISQVVENIFDVKMQENVITRSLLVDFSEKSEISADSSDSSSVVSYHETGGGSESRGKSSTDDDNASIWSIQVNASTRDEGEEEEVGIEQQEEDYYYTEDDVYDEQDEEEDEGGSIDELCEGLNKMSVVEMRKAPKFAGKHTRFVYNSDDEIEGEEEEEKDALAVVCAESEASSPSILHPKGLPTQRGKHFRFLDEE